eukprot:jgi/Psemu1/308025/fgenesh1_kg.373_\
MADLNRGNKSCGNRSESIQRDTIFGTAKPHVLLRDRLGTDGQPSQEHSEGTVSTSDHRQGQSFVRNLNWWRACVDFVCTTCIALALAPTVPLLLPAIVFGSVRRFTAPSQNQIKKEEQLASNQHSLQEREREERHLNDIEAIIVFN